MFTRLAFYFLFIVHAFLAASPVELGVDVFFSSEKPAAYKGKRLALVTNHTGINKEMTSTVDLFFAHSLSLVALFSPEHGLHGNAYASEEVEEKKGPRGIPIYNLHGKTRRPTDKMLEGIDVIFYDIQDIGSRSYTYTTTLFYVMEAAAKKKIPVVIFDRPNPINGLVVDGPMLQEKWRSYIGYVNVPYCHGLTVGELALFFNERYEIHCPLEVVSMKGYQRTMSYRDTGLPWVPTSPHVPESDTPLFYATTGILGELGLVSIGIGYTLPFKTVGAPWIDGERLAKTLNEQKLPGVRFRPFHYRPFYGLFKGTQCQGVMISITDPLTFRPVTTQYMILGILKNLYPKQVEARLNQIEGLKKELFCKANGNEEMLELLKKEKYIAWKLIAFQKREREAFCALRSRFFLYAISEK